MSKVLRLRMEMQMPSSWRMPWRALVRWLAVYCWIVETCILESCACDFNLGLLPWSLFCGDGALIEGLAKNLRSFHSRIDFNFEIAFGRFLREGKLIREKSFEGSKFPNQQNHFPHSGLARRLISAISCNVEISLGERRSLFFLKFLNWLSLMSE